MRHPETEILAAFVEGNVRGTELDELTTHLRECAECREVAGAAAAFHQQETPVSRTTTRRWWPAIAAAAAAVMIGLLFMQREREPLDELIAAAPRDVRFIEPRLSGFPHAQLNDQVRSGSSADDPRRMELTGAAGRVLRTTAGDTSTGALHATGVARLLTSQTQAAITSLEALTNSDAGAQAWNDLAAARYVGWTQDTAKLSDALAAADEALRRDPNMKEALFNRALILTALNLRDAAIAAWSKYLAVETDARWRVEAEQRLAMLREEKRAVFPDAIERAMPRLQNGDRKVALVLIQDDAGEVRSFFETEGLARWGEAVLRSDETSASALLHAARTVADALVAFNGDSLLSDIVKAIERADEDSRRTLARAHVLYRTGRRAYRPERKPREAEWHLSDSIALFDRRSPMVHIARTYRGVAIFAQNRMGEAESEFRQVAKSLPAQYAGAHAYIRWQLASCETARGPLYGAIESLNSAQTVFAALGEKANAAYLNDIVSQLYDFTGNRTLAWQNRMSALRELGRTSNHRLEHLIGGITLDATRNEEWRTAMSFLDIEVDLAQRVQDKELQTYLLLRRSLVASRLGEDAEARRSLRDAQATVSSVEDDEMRRRLKIEVDAAAALTASEPKVAIAMLSDALRFHDQSGWRLILPDLHLRRGRMQLLAGDRRAAAADFEAGISYLERQRNDIPAGELRWRVFDASEELFDEAIALAVQIDPWLALSYAERKRGRRAPAKGAALPHGVAAIEYAALPDRLLIFTATSNGYSARQFLITRRELQTRIEGFVNAIRTGMAIDRSLADILLPQVSESEIVFIPDATTAAVPFAALNIGDDALIERFTITISPGLATFLESTNERARRGRQRILIVDSPTNEELPSLARTRAEADAIEKMYPLSERISGPSATADAFAARAEKSDVIHFAGHAVAAAHSTAILLARTPGQRSTLDAAEIARLNLHDTDVVVLAACETGRATQRVSVITLANAFLEAGARSAIATLWPISDRDAAEFFPELHERLAAGERAADALRNTQLVCIHDSQCKRSGLWATVQSIGG